MSLSATCVDVVRFVEKSEAKHNGAFGIESCDCNAADGVCHDIYHAPRLAF